MNFSFRANALGILSTLALLALPSLASASVVYNAIPNPLAPNYPSQPFQAQQTSELGDYVHLGGTDRRLTTISVTMDNWALQATPANAAFCAANASNCDASGFNWPITVNVYSNHLGANGAPDTLLATKTVTQHIPWRPAEDSVNCPTKDSPGYAFKYQAIAGASDTNCYNGIAANVTFDLSSMNVNLPNDVIVSFVYNTQTYGPNPTGVDGPYNSLNIAVPPSDSVTVGTDDSADKVFWNTATAALYTNTNCHGNTLCEDTNWSPYGTVAMQINTVTPTTNTIVVTPANMHSWAFIDDTNNTPGSGSMVTGPSTPPLGTGSAQLTATTTSDGQILAVAYPATKLSDLTALSYSTYQAATNPSNATAIALQFNVDKDVTDADNSWQGRLVYEPYINNGGTVPLGSWNTWDALNGGNGKWWLSHSASQFSNNCSQASPCTLSQLEALYPNIGIHPTLGAIVLKAGSGWASFSGNADAVTIGVNNANTIYDFEPAPAAPSTFTVSILKYIGNDHATVTNANNATFPFTANYQASNLLGGNAGSDPFTIGPTGNGTPNPYEAKTVDLATGASYSATENVSGNDVVGASCTDGKPFALAGYSSGDTFAQAFANASSSATAPAFTNLSSNKVVIVWNKICTVTPPPTAPQVHIFKFVDGVMATAANANSTTFPMNASWVSSTLGTVPSVGFTLSPSGWGASDAAYEASYVGGAAGDNYATNEVLTTPVVGAQCDGSHTYGLQGYSTGNTLDEAKAGTQNTESPSFTNLQSDKYVIVWNKTCPTTASLTVTKSSIGGNGTFSFTSDIPGHASFQITTSNNQGSVTFDGIAPGTYHVTEVNQPKGWTQTDNSCDEVSLSAGQTQNCVVTDTSNKMLGSIRGSKFEDWDGDGSPFETRWERGLKGWTITITGPNGFSTSTVTNKQGLYIFSGLPAGTYTVREVQQTGWMSTYPSSNPALNQWVINLSAGQNAKRKDFGNFKLGTISGMKYEDKNGNHRKDNGEGGLQGWTIQLKKAGGGTLSTVTDTNGNYSFSDLTPGLYILSEVMQSGWKQTDKPNPVKVRSATSATHEDFGNRQIVQGQHDHDHDSDDE